MRYVWSSTVWKYNGEKAAWHFVGLPHDVAAVIKKKTENKACSFGSVPVVATIGNTSWQTSIFPDRRSESFLLPVKAAVRKTETLFEGDVVKVTIVVK